MVKERPEDYPFQDGYVRLQRNPDTLFNGERRHSTKLQFAGALKYDIAHTGRVSGHKL